MQSWIKEYTKEASPCLDITPFVEQNSTTENICLGTQHVGIFVYTVNQDICTIHIMWIKQKHRHKFRQAAKYIAEFVKRAGYKRVELVTDLRVCQLVERYLKLKPVQKIYLEEIDRILEVL